MGPPGRLLIIVLPEKLLLKNKPYIFLLKTRKMKTKDIKVPVLIVLLLIVLIFSGCTNKEEVEPCLEGIKYNFWGGLWHGIIAPIDLILMFFRDDITVYAQNNNGVWYALGFLIGSGGWGMLGGHSSKKKRNRN